VIALESIRVFLAQSSRRLTSLLVVLAASSPSHAFEYFEHKAIGAAAYRAAREGSASNDGLNWALAEVERRLGFTPKSGVKDDRPRLPDFGDLAALAGDHSKDTETLKMILEEWRTRDWTPQPVREGRPDVAQLVYATTQQLDNACRWLYRSTARGNDGKGAGSQAKPGDGDSPYNCFALLAEGNKEAAQVVRAASQGYTSSRSERAAFERLPHYVDLARDNRDHFPTHSWFKYLEHHKRAREAADCYRKGPPLCDKSQGDALLDAVVEEGFAQHFLQDSFASGHIGVEFGGCWNPLRFLLRNSVLPEWLCTPSKSIVHQTHNVLNEIGLNVRLLADSPVSGNLKGLRTWTAFGDGHYFVPEAAHHRYVVHITAVASLREVFQAADKPGTTCQLCQVTRVFPLPPEDQTPEVLNSPASLSVLQPNAESDPSSRPDLAKFSYGPQTLTGRRSTDLRVPDIPVEGWKFSVAAAMERIRDSRRPPPFTGDFGQGMALSLDYIRTTSGYWPNSLGLQYWLIPRAGTLLGGTAGWMWPSGITSPHTLTVKARLAYRVSTERATPPGARKAGFVIGIPIEWTAEIYPPVATYLSFDAVGLDASERRWIVATRRGERAVNFGIRFDLSGIL